MQRIYRTCDCFVMTGKLKKNGYAMQPLLTAGLMLGGVGGMSECDSVGSGTLPMSPQITFAFT